MSNAVSAVTAVQFSDLGAAQRWFELIGEEYTPDITWTDLRSALIDRGAGTVGSGPAEAFVEYAEALGGDPLDTFRDIAGDTGWAFATYAAAQPADSGEADGAAAEYDEATWYANLAENGPRWDGTENQWEPFVTWFLYQAGEAGLATPAQGFIDYVGAQPDKVAAFAAYGVTIAVPADGGASTTDYDPAAWDANLAENGPRWDGTEEAWEPFVTWFLYQAGQAGLATPAKGFIDYVNAQLDRVAAFAAYGVVITVSGVPEAAVAAAASEEVPELISSAGLQDELADYPDLAKLPPDELDAVLREALAEIDAAGDTSAEAES